jgi:hypothetical protein
MMEQTCGDLRRHMLPEAKKDEPLVLHMGRTQSTSQSDVSSAEYINGVSEDICYYNAREQRNRNEGQEFTL